MGGLHELLAHTMSAIKQRTYSQLQSNRHRIAVVCLRRCLHEESTDLSDSVEHDCRTISRS